MGMTMTQKILAAHAGLDKVEAGQLIEKHGIMASAAAATKAIPNCNIVCVTGREMVDMVTGMLAVLFDADPKSVGGTLPGEEMFWLG